MKGKASGRLRNYDFLYNLYPDSLKIKSYQSAAIFTICIQIIKNAYRLRNYGKIYSECNKLKILNTINFNPKASHEITGSYHSCQNQLREVGRLRSYGIFVNEIMEKYDL